ncbi:hypothetical protein FGG08_004330 [Glutinoglossum americanum]|uniref:Uncharacterized protein n=1 Tax=Glutinoglossum americanum TaxID=1670608 RepID=A0A9P8I5A4_9PEZI|nr:hypothetical protein FGG08_004330 [Glutinoglossum americanum]
MAVIPGLKIPQVTEDDLFEFHAHHFNGRRQGFPGTLLSDTTLLSLTEECCEDGDLEYDYDDDDGLGYYPDGVKRTLTDAQIAMFRWSEVQSLLRAKKRRLGGLEGRVLDESSAENKEKRKIERKHPFYDGGVLGEDTQSVENRNEKTIYSSTNATTSLESNKRRRVGPRESYGDNIAKKRDLHIPMESGSTLNYDDDAPPPQNQVSARDVLADEGEDEEEYEKFLARERQELCGTDSPERGADLGAGCGAKRGSELSSISPAVLGHSDAGAYSKELVQPTSTPTINTPPNTTDVSATPSASPRLESQWDGDLSNAVIPPGITVCSTTAQPMQSRRRIFYGDDDHGQDARNDKNPPKSAAPTPAGGVTKGEKRAFLWPKIRG